MVDKVVPPLEEVVADIPYGAVIIIGNLARPQDFPYYPVHALARRGEARESVNNYTRSIYGKVAIRAL